MWQTHRPHNTRQRLTRNNGIVRLNVCDVVLVWVGPGTAIPAYTRKIRPHMHMCCGRSVHEVMYDMKCADICEPIYGDVVDIWEEKGFTWDQWGFTLRPKSGGRMAPVCITYDTQVIMKRVKHGWVKDSNKWEGNMWNTYDWNGCLWNENSDRMGWVSWDTWTWTWVEVTTMMWVEQTPPSLVPAHLWEQSENEWVSVTTCAELQGRTAIMRRTNLAASLVDVDITILRERFGHVIRAFSEREASYWRNWSQPWGFSEREALYGWVQPQPNRAK